MADVRGATAASAASAAVAALPAHPASNRPPPPLMLPPGAVGEAAIGDSLELLCPSSPQSAARDNQTRFSLQPTRPPPLTAADLALADPASPVGGEGGARRGPTRRETEPPGRVGLRAAMSQKQEQESGERLGEAQAPASRHEAPILQMNPLLPHPSSGSSSNLMNYPAMMKSSSSPKPSPRGGFVSGLLGFGAHGLGRVVPVNADSISKEGGLEGCDGDGNCDDAEGETPPGGGKESAFLDPFLQGVGRDGGRAEAATIGDTHLESISDYEEEEEEEEAGSEIHGAGRLRRREAEEGDGGGPDPLPTPREGSRYSLLGGESAAIRCVHALQSHRAVKCPSLQGSATISSPSSVRYSSLPLSMV